MKARKCLITTGSLVEPFFEYFLFEIFVFSTKFRKRLFYKNGLFKDSMPSRFSLRLTSYILKNEFFADQSTLKTRDPCYENVYRWECVSNAFYMDSMISFLGLLCLRVCQLNLNQWIQILNVLNTWNEQFRGLKKQF